MAQAIAGSWTLDKSENYEEFLKAVGMNAIKRAMAVKLGGTLTITPVNGKLKVKSVNGPKTKEREMPIGQNFDDEGPNGGVAKGIWVEEGDKMVGTFTTEKGKKFVMTREVVKGQLVQTMDFDGTVCKRFFKK
uniref:Cytosolic fatty-acid binding proteins domain-containing protein n=1 Tax=Ciona savignyi TaxID=51511 RepID=H2YY68_CIOSA